MRRVLLVDDDADFRGVLAEFLEVYGGYSVTAVEDGEHAVEALRNADTSLCLVVVDLHLPSMTGWELVDWIRRELHPAPPIVVLTALPVRPEDQHGELVERFLMKPIEGDSL